MLQKCVICRYSLTGLPPRHNCPECGFPFDADAVVFRASPRPWGALVAASGTMIAVVLAVCVWRGHPLVLYGWSLPFGILLCGAILQLRRVRKAAVVVATDSVQVIQERRIIQSFELTRLATVHWNAFTGNVCLYDTHGRQIATIVLASLLLTRQVGKAIQRMIQEKAKVPRA